MSIIQRKKVLLGSAALATMFCGQLAWAQQANFDIPSEPATKAIPEFARQAGIQIVAPAKELRGVRTPAVKGAYDLHEALSVLLAGTNISIASDDGKTIVLTVANDAASGGSNIETVVVTARHLEEDAQVVPISLDVLGGKQLEISNQYTLNQLQLSVPSLSTFSSNARNSVINIRGLGSNIASANDGLENGIGFYIDGVYYGRIGQSQFDLVDLEQVEVLHGPQGTLFGKNTTAGAINVTTRKPSFTPEARLEGSVGDFNYYQVKASVSGPLWGDKVAGRLSVAKTQRGGFLHNVTTGVRLNDYDNFTARGQLLAEVTSDIELRLIADYSKQFRECCISQPYGSVITKYDNGTSVSDNFLTKAARAGYTEAPTNPYERISDVDNPVYERMETGGVSLQGDWNIGNALLTSITAYRFWNWDPSNDSDTTALAIYTQNRIIDRQHQWSQELRLTGSIGDSLDYQFGVYYFWQIINGFQTTSFGKDAALWYYGASTTVSQTVAQIALNGYKTKAFSNPETTSYATFGQTNWHITENLTLTTGLRYTYEDKKGFYRNVVTNAQSTDGLTAAQVATVASIRASYSNPAYTSGKLHSGNLSGLFTLSYQFDPDLLAYASYSHGEKSGGLNLVALPTNITDPRIKPEKVDDYEFGLKSQLIDNTLTLNLAAFWTNDFGYQAQIYDIYTQKSYLSNIPSVRSRGFEGTTVWAPTKHLSIKAAASYTEAIYVKYPYAAVPFELGGQGLKYVNVSGKPLAYAPKWVITTSVDASQPFTQPIFADLGPLEAYIHGDFRYETSHYTTASDSRYSLTPGHALANLRVGFRTENNHWDFSVWSNNVTNTHYLLSQSAQSTGLISATPGDPRTFGATLAVKY